MKSQNEVHWTDEVDSFGNPLLSDEVPQKPSQSDSTECEFCCNKATRKEFFDGEVNVCDKCCLRRRRSSTTGTIGTARHSNQHSKTKTKPWTGSVWMNPPYGREIERWIARLAEHGDGVALMFARTDTRWFQKTCRTFSAMLLLAGRVRFFDGQGRKFDRTGGGASATSPSVLIAFGEACGRRLLESSLDGIRVVPHA